MREHDRIDGEASATGSDLEITAFFDTRSPYAYIVENNVVYHREMFDALGGILVAHFAGAPFSVLDLGCGDAAYIAKALRGTSVQRYVGWDLSSVALGIAREHLATVGCTIELGQVDFADECEDNEERFDLVFSSYALHHLSLEKKKRFFTSARRRLHSGGILVVVDTIRDQSESRETRIDRLCDYLRSSCRDLPPDQLRELLEHVSLKDFPESLETYASLATSAGFSSTRAVRQEGLFAMFVCD